MRLRRLVTPVLAAMGMLALASCSDSQPGPPPNAAQSPPKEEEAKPELKDQEAPKESPSVAESKPEPNPPAPVASPEPAVSQAPPPSPEPPPSPSEPPPPPPPPPKERIKVLAPYGHIPDWLASSLGQVAEAEVDVDVYERPSEAIQKLRAPGAAYSLALLTDRLLAPAIAEQSLHALPRPNPEASPLPLFTGHHFDRDNRYGWPYAFSLAAFAVRADTVKPVPKSWGEIFRPQLVQETWMIGDRLLALGLMRRGRLQPADSLLPRAWPDPFKPSSPLPGGEGHSEPPAASSPTGSAASATDASAAAPVSAPSVAVGKPVRIASVAELKKILSSEPGWTIGLPPDGSLIYLYHVVLPVSSPNPERSMKLAQIFFDPRNTGRLTAENYLGATQEAARALQPPELLRSRLVYPEAAILDHCTFLGQ